MEVYDGRRQKGKCSARKWKAGKGTAVTGRGNPNSDGFQNQARSKHAQQIYVKNIRVRGMIKGSYF